MCQTPAAAHRRAQRAGGALVVLGEPDDAAPADVGGDVLPLLLPGLDELRRRRDLRLELLPELAERRLVGGRSRV